MRRNVTKVFNIRSCESHAKVRITKYDSSRDKANMFNENSDIRSCNLVLRISFGKSLIRIKCFYFSLQ